MLLANLLFSFVDTATKWLLGSGLAVLQLAFMRYASHFAITAIDLRRTPVPRLSTWRLRGLVWLRAFCLISATCVNFLALGMLPLAVTSAILFLAPVLVCLFAGVILGERVGPWHWGAIFLGFLGVLIVVDPFGEGVNLYAFLMLYPATGMAFYSILTRLLADQVRPSIMQFATGALGTAVLLPFGLLAWVPPETALQWVLLIGIGVFAWAGHEAMTRAHAHADASVLMPFGYSFVIYLSLAGWLVFDEVPGPATLIGSCVICVAGLMIWRLNRQTS